MSNMFGGGPQGQFGGQAFSGNAMNPMASGMEVQEVGVASGEVFYTTSLGSSKGSAPRDRSGRRRMPYMPGAWSWGGSNGGPTQGRY
jgi:hypothetical protein